MERPLAEGHLLCWALPLDSEAGSSIQRHSLRYTSVKHGTTLWRVCLPAVGHRGLAAKGQQINCSRWTKLWERHHNVSIGDLFNFAHWSKKLNRNRNQEGFTSEDYWNIKRQPIKLNANDHAQIWKAETRYQEISTHLVAAFKLISCSMLTPLKVHISKQKSWKTWSWN